LGSDGLSGISERSFEGFVDLLQTATDGLAGVACSHDHPADTRCDFRIERYDIAARDFDSLQLASVASFEVFSRLFLAVCVRLAVDISPSV
jgi:hypothetical protein